VGWNLFKGEYADTQSLFLRATVSIATRWNRAVPCIKKAYRLHYFHLDIPRVDPLLGQLALHCPIQRLM
jgi:hypothetical protein